VGPQGHAGRLRFCQIKKQMGWSKHVVSSSLLITYLACGVARWSRLIMIITTVLSISYWNTSGSSREAHHPRPPRSRPWPQRKTKSGAVAARCWRRPPMMTTVRMPRSCVRLVHSTKRWRIVLSLARIHHPRWRLPHLVLAWVPLGATATETVVNAQAPLLATSRPVASSVKI
jgi:hypothetical protein